MAYGDVGVRAEDQTREVTLNKGRPLMFLGPSSGAYDGATPRPLLERILKIKDRQAAKALCGYGPLTEYVGAAAAAGGPQYAIPIEYTAGSISAVTQTGSGPAMLATATSNPDGPFDAFDAIVKITKAGDTDSGLARFALADDGVTFGDDRDIPARKAAEVVSVDITGLLGTLPTLTYSFQTEDAQVVSGTLTGPFATPQSVADELNTAIAGAASNAAATIRSAKYLVIQSGSLGASSSLTISAGTANAVLGWTLGTVNGVDSVVDIGEMGVTLTFAAGVQVAGTTHAFVTTAPDVAQADYKAAMDLCRSEELDIGGFVICDEQFSDEFDFAARTKDLAAYVEGFEGAEPRVYWHVFMGTPATFDDQTIRNQFVGWFNRRLSIAIGDVYAQGTGFPLGLQRRSAGFAQGVALVYRDESQSIGEREQVPSCYSRSPDGSSLIRSHYTAAADMSDRFNVLLESKKTPMFLTGRTMANALSEPGFAELTWLRPFAHAMQITHDAIIKELEKTPALDAKGFLGPRGVTSINSRVAVGLDAEILRQRPPDGRASSCRFVYDQTNKYGETKKIVGTLKFQALGIAHEAEIVAQLTTEA